MSEEKRSKILGPESERLQRAILYNLPDPVWLKDLNGAYLAVNKAWCRVFEMDETSVIGKTDWDLVPKELAKKYSDEDRLILQSDTTVSYESKIVRSDGGISWFESVKSPMHDEDGSIIGVTGIARNITKRKLAEEALRESEDKYRLLVDHQPVGVVIQSGGIILFANHEAARLVGAVSPEAIVGMSIDKFVLTERLEAMHIRVTGLLAGEKGLFPVREDYVRLDGTTVPVEVMAVPTTYLGKTAIQVIVTDITNRVEMETRIRESEEYYRTLVETSPDAIAITDLQGHIVYGSPKAYELFGVPNEKGVQSLSITDLVAPTEHGDALNRMKQLLSGELKSATRVYRLRRFDKTEFWGELNSSRLVNARGKTTGVLVICRDITTRKHAEEELKRERNLLRTLIDNWTDYIYMKDLDGRFVIANKAVVEMFGFKSEAELVGKTDFDLFPHDLAARYHTEEQMILRSKQGLYDYEGPTIDPHKEEKQRWISTTKVPLRNADGIIIGTVGIGRDITDQRHAQETLRQSEERFRSLFMSMSEGCYLSEVIHDDKGNPCDYRYLEVNPKFEEIVKLRRDEIIGKRYKELVPVDTTPWLKVYCEVASTGVPRNFEFYSDEYKQYFETFSFCQTKNQITVFVVNITKRKEDELASKRAQEALRESEAKYRDLVEQINDVIFSIDVDGKITYVSPTAEALSGYASEEMIGHSIEEFIDPDFAEVVRQGYMDVMAGRIEPNEYRIVLKNGGYRWVRSSSRPILERNKPVGVRGVLTDISARKEAERNLTLLSHTVRSISECVSVTDLNNVLLYVNQAFLETYGYTAEEVIGKPIASVASTTGIDDKVVLRNTIEGGWQGELINRRKDGTEFPIFLSTSVVHNEEGKPVALVGIATDITEQKRLQTELLQSQKMQSIGTMAGGIAHDFNNILGIIVGYASLLERRLGGDPKCTSSITAIQNAAARGATLVKQILTFARKTEVFFDSVDITDLIGEIVTMLRQTFPKTITFSENIQKGLPSIFGDRTQIHQILLNLCVNARDAMPGGGSITLTAETQTLDQVRERFPEATNPSYIRLTVADTGEGMTEATRRRVFDPFFTTKPIGQGTGLGLSVVYGAIQAHHGFIDIESEVGRGTSVMLTFPTAPSEIINGRTLAHDDSPNLRGHETLLFVEDEADIVDLMEPFLKSNGYRVYHAGNGIEAIEIYSGRSNEIDLVISDLGLPGISGDEELRSLRLINPAVDVIIASGFFEPERKAKLSEEGAAAFLEKPYNPGVMLRLIRNTLDRRKKIK